MIDDCRVPLLDLCREEETFVNQGIQKERKEKRKKD